MGLLYDVFSSHSREFDRAVLLTDTYLARLDTPCYAVCINGEPHSIAWPELCQMAREAREAIANYEQRGERRLAQAGMTLEDYKTSRGQQGVRSTLESIGRASETVWATILGELP